MPGFPAPFQQQAQELGNASQRFGTRSRCHEAASASRLPAWSQALHEPGPSQPEKCMASAGRPLPLQEVPLEQHTAREVACPPSSPQPVSPLHTQHSHLVTAL